MTPNPISTSNSSTPDLLPSLSKTHSPISRTPTICSPARYNWADRVNGIAIRLFLVNNFLPGFRPFTMISFLLLPRDQERQSPDNPSPLPGTQGPGHKYNPSLPELLVQEPRGAL